MLVTQSCLTLYNPMVCSPSGSSVPWGFPGKNVGYLPNPEIEPGPPTLQKAQTGMKVIFQALDKLFIAGQVQDHYHELNYFQAIFKGSFQNKTFVLKQTEQSDLTVLCIIFCGIIFKLFH